MRKLNILILLAFCIIFANAAPPPQKLSVRGRALSTEGKVKHDGNPGACLYMGESDKSLSTVGFSMRPQAKPSARIVSASGTDLQGFLKASSSASFPAGWYDINVDGTTQCLYTNTAMMGSCGFVRDGKICQFSTINSYGYYWFYYSEYDLLTGEELYEVELPDTDMRNYVVNCVYDEREDVVYMQSYAQNFSGMAWSKFNPETRERTYLNNGLSWDDNRVVAIGLYPRDKGIYGIKATGEYVKINTMTGVASKICDLAVSPAEFSQSMIYAPVERGFVWAAMLDDNTSGFYRIEPATGEVTLLGKMPAQNQFLMLYCPDKDSPDAAPAMPGFSHQFDGPSLSGKIMVTLPTETFGGEAIDGGVSLVAEVIENGTTIASVNGKPGATVSADVTLAQAEHDVVVRCRYSGSEDWSPERKTKFYVGHDSPSAPGQVRIVGNKIKWSAPTTSVHGGYVDYANLEYTVRLNDIEVTAAPVSGTEVTFSTPVSLAIYYAKVYATANDMTSEAGKSEGTKFGTYLEFPFSITPTDKEFTLLTVVDGNKDGNSWKYFTGKDCIYYNSGNSRQADDWLLLPMTDFLDAEHLYRLTFEVKSLLVSRPEDFEICLLKSSDPTTGVAATIASYPAYGNDQWTEESIKFNVPESGYYHIAFHCTTPEGFQLMLQNIRGEKTEDTMRAPAECKGVSVEGASNGKLEAKVSFMTPVKALDGSALDSSEEIEVIARTAAGEGRASVLPGKKGELTVPCIQGNNRVRLVTRNEGGEGIDKEYFVYTGQEKPGKVKNLKNSVSDDNLTMTITWDPPTEGESGGYVNPDEVKYYIYTVSDGELSFLEDIGGSRTYSLTVPSGAQALQQLAVAPYNVAGAASTGTFAGTSAILGTPLEVPFTETFTWGIPSYLPNVIMRPNGSYTAQWGHGDPTAIVYEALSPDYGCMYSQPSVSGLSLGRVEIPRVSTDGFNNVTFRLKVYRFPQGGVVRVLGRANGSSQYIEIGEIDTSKGTKGYVEELYKLPESLQNCPWIALAIETEFDCENTNTYVIIDDYALLDLPDNDICLSTMSGDNRLRAGQEGHYSVEVLNRGKETQLSSVLWEVVDSDGKVLKSQENVVSPLDQEETELNEFTFVPEAEMTGDYVTVRATSLSDPDDTPANNVLSMSVAMLSTGTGLVKDLRAEMTDDAVMLQWSRPQLDAPVSEGFESLEAGAYGDKLGEWKNIDGDEKPVCSIQGVDLPDAGAAKGWQVIDKSLSNLFIANGGNKFLLAMTPSDESAANDWLISPEVAGGSEIAIAVNILSPQFTEEFEILTSSTDDNPESFSRVASFRKNTLGWQTYLVTLPSDARYFAVRYCGVNQFGMMIDDIDYSSADHQAVPAGYNVYRDNQLLSVVGNESYEDRDVEASREYRYFIVPLVEVDGTVSETVHSNEVSVKMSGIASVDGTVGISGSEGCVIVRGLEGKVMRLYRADGVCRATVNITSPCHIIPVEPGIYVATTGDVTVKVFVR